MGIWYRAGLADLVLSLVFIQAVVPKGLERGNTGCLVQLEGQVLPA